MRIWMHTSSSPSSSSDDATDDANASPDGTMLFTGRVKIVRDARFSLEDTTLVIAGVAPADAGAFVCRIMLRDEVNLAHTLSVVEAFNVKPVSEEEVLQCGVCNRFL